MNRGEFKALTASLGCEYDIISLEECYFDVSKEYNKPAIILASKYILLDMFSSFEYEEIEFYNETANVYKIDNITYIGTKNTINDFNSELKNQLLKLLFDEEVLREHQKKQTEENVIKIVTATLEKQRRDKEWRLEEAIKNKNVYTKYLQSECERILEIKASMNDKATIKELKEKLIQDIANINSHEMTTNFEIEENFLSINTNTIYTTESYTDKRYHIGKMLIKLPLTTNNETRILCIDNKRYGYWGEGCPFPHISRDGTPCFGNAEGQIIQYISEKMYYAAYATILSYLQTGVDIDDCAGWYLSCWDEVDDNNKVINKGHAPERDEYDGYGCNDNSDEWDDDACECEICGRTIPYDETEECNDCGRRVCNDCYNYLENADRTVCNICLRQDYTMCYECGEYYLNDDVTKCGDGNLYCEGCAEDFEAYNRPDDNPELSF